MNTSGVWIWDLVSRDSELRSSARVLDEVRLDIVQAIPNCVRLQAIQIGLFFCVNLICFFNLVYISSSESFCIAKKNPASNEKRDLLLLFRIWVEENERMFCKCHPNAFQTSSGLRPIPKRKNNRGECYASSASSILSNSSSSFCFLSSFRRATWRATRDS